MQEQDPELQIARWYEVDEGNRIIGVCPEWDALALAHQSLATSDRVIGLPLTGFIAGDPTRMYTDALLQSVRLTRIEREARYRCDTPWTERHLAMRLLPQAQGRVRIEHAVLSVRTREQALRFVTAPAAELTHRLRCSVCLWVQMPPRPWEPPDRLSGEAVPVRYTVCRRCQAEARMQQRTTCLQP